MRLKVLVVLFHHMSGSLDGLWEFQPIAMKWHASGTHDWLLRNKPRATRVPPLKRRELLDWLLKLLWEGLERLLKVPERRQ